MQKEAKKQPKSIEERIDRIYKTAKQHYGEVRFVGIKKHRKIGWVAKIQFDEFESLVAEGENPEQALKKLRKRLKKIIERYNMV
jgi:CRISPR/Cas system-associated endoribonuclease Cas2